MAHFGNRPKGKYIHEADWQQLYALTEHWKSDFQFYNTDLTFLQHVIYKNFM